ncbi:MAG TPA: Crp/Fnr family transcriptional regulator [Actinomycetota bacterium]|nr:Crp/Fnr family transcriptional regulator [Actinomycetota bacterium]
MTRRRSQADEQALQRVLRDSPVFGHGSPSNLAALVTQATPFDYPPGSFLMRQGEPADFVLVLTAGEVAIVSPVRGGAEQVHSIVRAGQLIGELALLTDGRRTAGARAASPTTAWAIGRDHFWAFLDATPAASSALLRQLAELLADREALIDDLLSLDIKGRLAKALLGLAERYGEPSAAGGTRITLRLTHRDLAGMVGASRENVSRALGAFRRRGFVDYEAESLRLLDLAALRRLT